MSRVKFSSKGDFANAIKFMMKYHSLDTKERLENVAKETVSTLSRKSPRVTGQFAEGWKYDISKEPEGKVVSIYNDSHPEVENLAEKLEYGYRNGTGAFIGGRHFIVPAMKRLESYISKELGGVVEDVK